MTVAGELSFMQLLHLFKCNAVSLSLCEMSLFRQKVRW